MCGRFTEVQGAKGSSCKGGMMIIEKPVGSFYCFSCCGHVASIMELA